MIVLDTHVLTWVDFEERKLGRKARALIERLWIVTFIVLAFVFSVLAPWYLAVPLVLFSSGLGVLDGLAHRAILGRQWVAAPVILGVRGARPDLDAGDFLVAG